MKRFASHYLFLPGYGYLKQYVVEVDQGYAVRIFPLKEEVEDVEWLPGVIALFPEGPDGELASYLYYPFDFISGKVLINGSGGTVLFSACLQLIYYGRGKDLFRN